MTCARTIDMATLESGAVLLVPTPVEGLRQRLVPIGHGYMHGERVTLVETLELVTRAKP